MRNAHAIILILLCCLSMNMNAQHWFGVSVDADLAWQLDKINITKSQTGGGASVGAIYQFQYQHFTIETGINASYTRYNVGVKDTLLQFDMIDTKGHPFVYKGYLKDRTEASNNLSISIPLMLGGEYKYFYGLAGAKINLNLLSRASQTALLSTSGEYDIYYDPLTNMPNHGFRDLEKVQSPNAIKYKMLDVRLAAEIGAVINPPYGSAKFRIGVFAEYGLLNTRISQEELPFLVPDVSKYMQVQMNHIYSSSYEPLSPVNNLQIGIRFAYLFKVGDNRNRYCRLCQDEFIPRKYKKKCVICR